QARRDPVVADVAAAGVADGLRREPGLADRVGQVRHPRAVLAHRHRHRRAAPGAARDAARDARAMAERSRRRDEAAVRRRARRAPGSRGMTPEISVVVPVCNEAENVEPLVREIDAALANREHEMIFVDDGSTDDTLAVLKVLKAMFPRLRVL